MARRTILIAEDDENVAQLLAFLLTREGFAVEVVADGRAAEEFAATHSPAAAVVLDINLPYRDGFEVATVMRGDPRWKDVPIVALTARTLPADVERSRALGLLDYIAKPFHPGALAQRLRTLLRAQAAEAPPPAEGRA